MLYVWLIFRWFLAGSLSLLLLSCVLREAWFPALLLGLAVIAIIPLSDPLGEAGPAWLLHPFTRIALVLVAILVFTGVLRISKPDSIYASEQVQARLDQIYAEKMLEWPVPFEDLELETKYGRVHVVMSGQDGLPPLLLLHASGVSSWSWKYNVETLSEAFQIFAIDLIGDAGKSEFRSLDHVFHSGKDQADLYAEIADSLGISISFVVGASEGGFIATNYAIYHPERVEKLALIGPMGYSGAVGAIIRIMITQLFPLRFLQESTFEWAFSRSPKLQEDFGEWFHLVMGSTAPIKVAPMPFAPEERRRLRVPVLFILGERDNLVGEPQRATARVQDIPDVTVEILDAGHLVAAEDPASTNELLCRFFGH